MKIQLGRYVCDGQVPIVVTAKGTPPGEPTHGPWITYHLEGAPEHSTVVVWTTFEALLELGYRHESETT